VPVKVNSFIDMHQRGERGLLIHVRFPTDSHADDMDEFVSLVGAANIQVIVVKELKRTSPVPKYFIGYGQSQQIKNDVDSDDIDVVLINKPISAAQGRNLEELLGCRVIDRNELILDIFSQRALSFEGKLQVEYAQLKHIRSRLIRGWTHLERQKGGIGLRGPGETQLETDRRLIDVRLKSIKKRLDHVFKQRGLGRANRQRNATPLISFVGYTNAGKSTLFNQVTESSVYVKDQLFATLDPTLRKTSMPTLGDVVFADTVGFIRDLPHDLIAAFRATLEETKQADLLVHVVDCSDPDYKEMIDTVNGVIHEIGAESVPVLYVYNKIDQRDMPSRIDNDSLGLPRTVWLSAREGLGVELFQQAVTEILSQDFINTQITVKASQSKLRAKLYSIGAVQHEKIKDDGDFLLSLKIRRVDYQRLLSNFI
jgi:GTPase